MDYLLELFPPVGHKGLMMMAVGRIISDTRFYFLFSRQAARQIYGEVEESLRPDIRLTVWNGINYMAVPEHSDQPTICVDGPAGLCMAAGWVLIQHGRMSVELPLDCCKVQSLVFRPDAQQMVNGLWVIQDYWDFWVYVFYSKEQALSALERHSDLECDLQAQREQVAGWNLPETSVHPLLELSGKPAVLAAVGVRVAHHLE